MFICAVCFEEYSLTEGTLLHHNHYLCIPCCQLLIKSLYLHCIRMEYKWNSELTQVEYEPNDLLIVCPLCRVASKVFPTKQTYEEIYGSDQEQMLQNLYLSNLNKLKQYEMMAATAKSSIYGRMCMIMDDSVRYFYEVYVEYFNLSSSDFPCPQSIQSFITLQNKILEQFTPDEFSFDVKEFQYDVIEIYGAVNRVLQDLKDRLRKNHEEKS